MFLKALIADCTFSSVSGFSFGRMVPGVGSRSGCGGTAIGCTVGSVPPSTFRSNRASMAATSARVMVPRGLMVVADVPSMIPVGQAQPSMASSASL